MIALSNLSWLAVAVAAFCWTPRRSTRATLALACAVALLFPIISIADDFVDNDAMDQVQAIAVVPVIVIAALIALAAVEVERRSRAALLAVVHADPRSPPRR